MKLSMLNKIRCAVLAEKNTTQISCMAIIFIKLNLFGKHKVDWT